MITAERLTAIKKYCRVDYDEDDTQLTGFAEMSDSYLAQCGITRDGTRQCTTSSCRQWCSTSTMASVQTMQPQPWLRFHRSCGRW